MIGGRGAEIITVVTAQAPRSGNTKNLDGLTIGVFYFLGCSKNNKGGRCGAASFPRAPRR